MFTSSKVMDGGFEPRIAIGPDGTHWVSTQGKVEEVYKSPDGVHWTKTAADPPAVQPNQDNEIVVLPNGRVITADIAQGITFSIAYSDDGGQSWTASQGNVGEDQDREWLAVGGKDPQTGQSDVYLLWHNLASGTAQHNMFVATSRDGGATFGPPVPIALPPSQAYLDLQCADSGGPSNIVANQATGQVYAIYGTRSSAVGGCGASAFGTFEVNVVASTRIWVATSKDQGMTWTNSLAVDDSAAGNIVGMQVNAGTLDRAGNVYVVYPESPKAYPDYEGAAVKYVWAAPDLGKWSTPVTVAPAQGGGDTSGVGNLLTHIAAGDPGHVAAFFLQADAQQPNAWYPMVAVTHDGLAPAPAFTAERVGGMAWNGSASILMGACAPLGDVPLVNGGFNGLACSRSSDVYGQAIGPDCRAAFTWYASPGNKEGTGTFATKQTGGPSLCAT